MNLIVIAYHTMIAPQFGFNWVMSITYQVDIHLIMAV